MADFRKELTDLLRPQLKPPGFTQDLVDAIDALLDRAGVPRDAAPEPAPAPAPAPAPVPASAPAGRLDVAGLRARLGLAAGAGFDAAARAALFARLANKMAPALTDADLAGAAATLGVSAKIIAAVRKVETARDPFDDDGRPTILYERHVFARQSAHRFDKANPALSSKTPGGYGKFSAQYGKLGEACALDPEAAFQACSWGAFQVLGENAVAIGYPSAFDMALALTVGEAAHLDCFVRFVTANKLVAALRACKAGDPASCIPFVRAYNGPEFAKNDYHVKLANAAR
jgi:N-acetylmuramidase